MFPLIGTLAAAGISAGTRLYAGQMADDATASSNAVAQRQYKQQMAYKRKMDRKNIELQKQFAQQSIRWKVADAEAAGIHPLYALGAQTSQFSPVSVGGPGISGPTPETGMANALAESGQDISRAITATMTQQEREYQQQLRAAQLTGLGLDNEMKAAQIAKLRLDQVGPPMPSIGFGLPEAPTPPYVPEAVKHEDRPQLKVFGYKIPTHSGTSTAQEFQRWTGDEGPMSWLAGIPGMSASAYLIGRDFWKVMRDAQFGDPAIYYAPNVYRGYRRY